MNILLLALSLTSATEMDSWFMLQMHIAHWYGEDKEIQDIQCYQEKRGVCITKEQWFRLHCEPDSKVRECQPKEPHWEP